MKFLNIELLATNFLKFHNTAGQTKAFLLAGSGSQAKSPPEVTIFLFASMHSTPIPRACFQ